MNWQQVCEEPSLQDLPFKIELNEYGQVVMSPASNEHGYFQMQIGTLLNQHLSTGRVLSECSIDTAKGVKVADVAWLSESFAERHGFRTPYPEAPAICVEIFSPSNSEKEMQDKIALYFAQGAQEIWICDARGELTFHTRTGGSTKSILLPDFPPQI